MANYRNLYQVRPGENLLQIAQNQGIDYADLLYANPGINRVTTGQMIGLPAIRAPGAYNVPLPPTANRTFGPPPPQGRAPYTPPPLNSTVYAQGQTNTDDWALRMKGMFPKAKPTGTGVATAPGTASLLGPNASSGGSYFANNSRWIQNDLEGNAFRLRADYGVRGDKWRTRIVQDKSGNWVKLTVPDRGGLSKSDKRKMRGLPTAGGGGGAREGPFLQNLLAWRLATG